ncbi:hypothetical protein [Piscinibacter sp. HJYY11]|uniref:hypothetical protein n=1 Tax=Piscinibacter sp. HJYY11 TaxID=2801333 RepID=UPI00191F97EE|nr:hypothetical protein [Piscinibacter sp. HJYY11]MBL0726183.1 hypothetical protein [Piscinibacter sp. HJYY11]
MKLTKISLGVAAACALLSAPAHALLATAYTNTGEFTGDTMNIRVSGATAQDPGLLASALRYCTAGSMTRYSISNNFVYFCTANTSRITPRAGATKVAFYKYSVGGSGAGVGPVNAATPLPFLDLTRLATSCAGTSSTADVDGTGPLPTFQDIACAGASSALTTNAVSYIGVSDVEPQFFGGPSTYNNLRAEGLATVIFGVPVTRNIYEALQGVQGLTVGAIDEANMPSLTQGQVTSLYTQEGQTWSGLTGATVGDDMVYVARRADSSGTQKSFEAVVARTTNGTGGARQCQSDVEPFVSGPAALDNTAANSLCNGSNLVVNGSGSGQVLACLNAHQAGGRGAIGTISTEFKQTAGGSLRFVKINGAAPTHANVASGRYTQYTDASLNTRIGTTLPTASAAGYSAFLTVLKNDFADPAVISVINAGNQTFGPSGLMALDALEASIPAPDFTGTSGRNPWSRLVGGTDLNNCQPGKLAAF